MSFPPYVALQMNLPVSFALQQRFIGMSVVKLRREKRPNLAGLDRTDLLSALAREQADAFVVDFSDLKREVERG